MANHTQIFLVIALTEDVREKFATYSRYMTGHAPILLLLAATFASSGFVARQPSSAAEPARIAGGRFEASGVVHVPSTQGVLFVDDRRTSEVFWMELNGDGSQKSPAVSIPLDVDVTDLESITHDGASFSIVGSQSKTTAAARWRWNSQHRI